MRTILFLALASLLLSGCSCGKEKLVDAVCGAPCYGGPVENAGKGICSKGFWECGEGDPVCVAWIPPGSPQCNGLDNDCDGLVDSPVEPCETLCGKGFKSCSHTEWTECSAPMPAPEVCNGRDDNCDGVVDNPDQLPVQFCYSGIPAESVAMGDCHPGTLRCEKNEAGNSVLVCRGQKVPASETCDSIDNDCDGQIDEGTTRGVDIVFLIDFSCSMSPYLTKMNSAISNWSVSYSSSDFQFSLVAVPPPEYQYDGTVKLETNLTSSPVFLSILSQMTKANFATGTEPTYDGFWNVLDPSNPLGLLWREDSKKIVIFFGDEPGLSVMNPGNTEASNEALAVDAGIEVNMFIPSWSLADYDSIAFSSGGKIFDLQGTTDQMKNALDQMVLKDACK